MLRSEIMRESSAANNIEAAQEKLSTLRNTLNWKSSRQNGK
jgi:hypothetical protein